MPALAGCLSGGLVGEPLPEFEVVTIDGDTVNASTYEGKWLVLDLMATWCPPCKDQTRHLRDVQATLGERVEILSISTDPSESLADMEKFATDFGVTWPHALDPSGKVARTFDTTRIPLVLVVNPNGTIVEAGQGGLLPAAIIRQIDPTLAPPGTPLPWMPFLSGLAAGFVAWMNPYRRFHREAGVRALGLALAAFSLFAALAWTEASWVSARITLLAFLVGAASLVAALWWLRARKKPADEPTTSRFHLAWATGDRLYEGAPHFTLALALALSATSTLAFAAPLAGFLAGAAASIALRDKVPAPARVWLGLAGLALVGFALVRFGAPLVLGEVSA